MSMKLALPFIGMIIAECAQVGLIIISKVVMSKGMSLFIFVCYSNALASLILLPLSLLFHQRSERPKLTFPVVGGFILLGILGCLAQFFGYAGINLSSPTLGSAMLNLVPGLTFILAVAFRMEQLDSRTSSSLAKSMGTVISVGGAFIMTYYKGIPVLMTPSLNSSQQLLFQPSNWIVGGLLLAADCVMASAWIIVQVVVLKKYPAELIVVFFYCFFVTILSAMVCLVVEKDPSAWSLKPNIRLLSVLYSGVFGSALQVGLGTWCLRQTGPVFVSMFKPVGIVIAAAVGVIWLGDTLYFGSLLGATVIVFGFYAVMWGKYKEQKVIMDDGARSALPVDRKVPLLQSHVDDM